jgi:GTPase
MQNQTPEIQAKLLAMQRAMVTKATTPTTVTVSQSFEDMDEDSLSSLDSSESDVRLKFKPELGSKESREEQMR